MQVIRIDKGRVIPVAFSLIGTFLLFLLYKFLHDHLASPNFAVAGILISPVLPVLWTMRKILEINATAQTIVTFIWVMGTKFKKTSKTAEFDRLIIQHRKSPKFSVHAGYLVLKNDDKIALIYDMDEGFVVGKMEKFSKRLGLLLKNDSQEPKE